MDPATSILRPTSLQSISPASIIFLNRFKGTSEETTVSPIKHSRDLADSPFNILQFWELLLAVSNAHRTDALFRASPSRPTLSVPDVARLPLEGSRRRVAKKFVVEGRM